MWPSFDTYDGSCVSKYELYRNSGNSSFTAWRAAGISVLFVTSPGTVKTATCGGLAPFPNTRSVVWFVS